MEDDPIDTKYNEQGREFGGWLLASYDPHQVYDKLRTLLVEGSGNING
jgi:hypothetical protein